MPPSVRLLFCHILIHENSAEPRKLYDAFEDEMMSDYVHRFRRMLDMSEEEILSRERRNDKLFRGVSQ